MVDFLALRTRGVTPPAHPLPPDLLVDLQHGRLQPLGQLPQGVPQLLHLQGDKVNTRAHQITGKHVGKGVPLKELRGLRLKRSFYWHGFIPFKN